MLMLTLIGVHVIWSFYWSTFQVTRLSEGIYKDFSQEMVHRTLATIILQNQVKIELLCINLRKYQHLSSNKKGIDTEKKVD